MPVINFTNPTLVLLGLILFLLVLYLGREVKKAWVIGIMLFVFLGLLIAHAVEFVTFAGNAGELHQTLLTCSTVDLIFIFLSFISYLWVDDIETKLGKKKSIDNSLEWFWNKV
ncbi:MAG: hypothetical protein HFJ31_00385, partial [Clostridia bacterium]|nr:hypothetical protein [Clostridia bacterium]